MKFEIDRRGGRGSLQMKSALVFVSDMMKRSRYLDAIAFLKGLEKRFPADIAVYSALARCYIYAGLFKDADFYARKRLTLLKPDTVEYVSALNQRATAFCGMGKYAESKTFTLQCIHMVKKMRLEETMEYAQVFLTASLVGIAYENWEAALEGYTRAKEILYALGPEVEKKEDYVEIFGSLTTGLGCCFQNTKRYDEAFACFDVALSETKRLGGKTHLSYATTLHALGSFYSVTNRIYLAVHLYEKAYSVYAKLLGKGHSMTVHLYKEIQRIIGLIQQDKCKFCQSVPYECKDECFQRRWFLFKNDCFDCMVCSDSFAVLNRSRWGALYCNKKECKKIFK